MTNLIYKASNVRDFCRTVSRHGLRYNSRQGEISEMLMTSFDVDPAVLDACRIRKFNLGFAVAEFASLVTGRDEESMFTAHIADYTRFCSNGKLDNSYGSRVSMHIESLIGLLKTQPTARQAVLTINDTELHMLTKSLHHPCTLSIQFLIRDDKLHMQVNMRSNDAYLGVTTDVVVFRLLQLYIASHLNVVPGRYTQTAGSLHVYDWALPVIDMLPNSSKSFAPTTDLFYGANAESLQLFADSLNAQSNCKQFAKVNDLPTGLSDLLTAATCRWHGETDSITDHVMKAYCKERYAK